jgi:ABC-type multidrug transport system ATPase subunit
MAVHDPRSEGSSATHHPSHEPNGAAASEPVLEARGLCKNYGARQALVDASLRVASGEGVALLGPNGSGKTTLLCLLAGVLPNDGGAAYVLGASTKQRKARRALAFVPQDAAIYDGLTVRENIAFFARLHGLRAAALHQAVDGALSASELGAIADTRASALSGGTRRRLSLSCALVHTPRVLLLDEPFEGVDDSSRDHLLEVLRLQKTQGVAVVMSTHRLHEVGALCERFVLLREGRVVAQRGVEALQADIDAQSPIARTLAEIDP